MVPLSVGDNGLLLHAAMCVAIVAAAAYITYPHLTFPSIRNILGTRELPPGINTLNPNNFMAFISDKQSEIDRKIEILRDLVMEFNNGSNNFDADLQNIIHHANDLKLSIKAYEQLIDQLMLYLGDTNWLYGVVLNPHIPHLDRIQINETVDVGNDVISNFLINYQAMYSDITAGMNMNVVQITTSRLLRTLIESLDTLYKVAIDLKCPGIVYIEGPVNDWLDVLNPGNLELCIHLSQLIEFV